MKHIFKLFKPYLGWFIVLVIFTYFTVIANLWLPDKMAVIVNDGIVAQNLDAIWHNGLQMIGVTVIGGICAVVTGFLSARIATGLAK